MFKVPSVHKLSNGVRVLLDPLPGFESVAYYIVVGTGSRNENGSATHSELGISHVLEHMVFKGTAKRTHEDIVNETASAGGLLNAYTSFDRTAYHIMLLRRNMDFALDIISDIFLNASLPADELEKEKSVIIQEILTYMDNPQAQSEELLNKTIYRGGLAHDVAGTIETVAGMTRDDLLKYRSETYSPENTILSLSGAIGDKDEVLAKLEKIFGGWSAPAPRDYNRTSYHRGISNKSRPDLEHSYLKMVWPSTNCLDRTKNLRAIMLAYILGRGMHSRLYREVRHNLNLVYYIGAHTFSLEDVGTFHVEAQTMPGNAQAVFDASARIIKDLPNNPITDEELMRAKETLRASKTIAFEDPLRRADSFAGELLTFGELRSMDEFNNILDSMTTADVMAVAKEMFSQLPTITSYGAPHDCDLDATAKKFLQ